MISITGKALSGEWGTDDETGKGIPVLRTTNVTNYGVIDYRNVVTRSIAKKNLKRSIFAQEILLSKNQGAVTSSLLVVLCILKALRILISLITSRDY